MGETSLWMGSATLCRDRQCTVRFVLTRFRTGRIHSHERLRPSAQGVASTSPGPSREASWQRTGPAWTISPHESPASLAFLTMRREKVFLLQRRAPLRGSGGSVSAYSPSDIAGKGLSLSARAFKAARSAGLSPTCCASSFLGSFPSSSGTGGLLRYRCPGPPVSLTAGGSFFGFYLFVPTAAMGVTFAALPRRTLSSAAPTSFTASRLGASNGSRW